MHYFVSFLFCNHLDGEERTVFFYFDYLPNVFRHVMHYFVFFLFCNHLDGEERTGCFTLIIFLVSCDMLCITLCLSCFSIILMVKREPVVLL